MNKRTETVITGEFLLPEGQAYSIRAIGLGKILRSAEHNVWFQGVCPVDPPYNNKKLSGLLDGSVYQNIPTNTINTHRLFRLGKTMLRGCNAYKGISKIDPKPTNVVLNSLSSRYLLPFLWGAWRRRWNLFIDAVEWYDYSKFPTGCFGPHALDCHITMTQLIPLATGVIAISTFLENYYKERGIPVIRIPQILDLDDAKWNFGESCRFDSTYTNFVYAGVPGQKDLIGHVVRAVNLLTIEDIRVKLHLIGPTREEIRHLLTRDSDLVDKMDTNCLIFHGHRPAAEVPALLAKADYSVLLRPDARYSKAGFPTKLTESFAAGVPLIGNLTGDIGLYLRNGETGWIVHDASVNALVAILKRSTQISQERYRSMRDEVKAEARRAFDYRNYITPLREFVELTTSTATRVDRGISNG